MDPKNPVNPDSSRISLLCNHLAGSREQLPVFSSLDFCFFDELLTPEEVKFRKEVREFAEKEITPNICEYVEKAEFPESIVKKLGEKDWFRPFLMKPYGEEKSSTALGLLFLEVARADASMATVMFPVVGVIFYCLQFFATEEQKKKLFPDLLSLKKLGAFCLTEENIGSDAVNLQMKARKVPGGYELEGNKRWPGNANRDLLVVFARREETKEIEGFLVDLPNPKVKTEKIEHKLSMRSVQNFHITFDKVFVSEENKLITPANIFQALGIGLATSRVLSGWVATGIAIGVYDAVIKYINNRTQFGVKISSFQLTQEKLSRIMGHIQAMLLMVWRVSKLYEDRKMTAGMASMCKAWTTSLCREVVRLGREMMGGNGIISDNYVMRALVDIEGVYTYEGTYDINVLLLGRELTGINAFKPKSQ